MFIPSTRANSRSRSFTPKQPTVEILESEVHNLTEQTDHFRSESTAGLAITSTAGLATVAGGAVAFLPAAQTFGLAVAGIAGFFFRWCSYGDITDKFQIGRFRGTTAGQGW